MNILDPTASHRNSIANITYQGISVCACDSIEADRGFHIDGSIINGGVRYINPEGAN
ncbi:hypothetical protein [Sphingorhabdus sp.]|uniref:hypothetical protein n=1 Tax=Sphingorhabdus sp. TaxID=1902408 RepID=UPI0039198FF8